jgi:hypothetical protein
MSSFAGKLASAARRVMSMVTGLLPAPPSDDGVRPDIDGRRPMEADLTRINVDLEAKGGTN